MTAAAPGGRERAKNLLWAAGRLADWAIGLGLDPVPEVLLHPSVIERFTAHAPGLTGRDPADAAHQPAVPGPGGRSRAGPGGRAAAPRARQGARIAPREIDGYLALAAAQPTAARRMRAAGLVCLGAGAGLIRADLRAVRGSDIICRSGGVIVDGARRAGRGRCRCWPATTSRCWPPRRSPGTAWSPAGTDPARRNVTTPLITRAGRRDRAAPAGHHPAAGHLAGRLRRSCSGWPRSCTPPGSPAASGSATCSPPCDPGSEAEAVALLGRAAVSIPLARLEDIIDASGIAPRIEALLPAGVRHRQLSVRTLILGMMLTLADRRPAHLTEVHDALTALPAADQARLGVTEDWKTGPHQLTYRQVERTFGLIAGPWSKDEPDGAPSDALAAVLR